MASDPTLKDVMAMLKNIEGKITRAPSPSRAPRDRSQSAKRPRSVSDADKARLAMAGGGTWGAADVIERVLYPRAQIVSRVHELATQNIQNIKKYTNYK